MENSSKAVALKIDYSTYGRLSTTFSIKLNLDSHLECLDFEFVYLYTITNGHIDSGILAKVLEVTIDKSLAASVISYAFVFDKVINGHCSDNNLYRAAREAIGAGQTFFEYDFNKIFESAKSIVNSNIIKDRSHPLTLAKATNLLSKNYGVAESKITITISN